uniref:Apple domain-containing protein n=1 Tax=Pyricularia oryzae (strain P131) TaxID=1143193 RepID=L7J9Q3_PYRO1
MASKYLIFAFFSILITLTAAFTCTNCAALELRPPSTGMPWDKDGSSSQHVATPSKRDDAQLIQPDGPHQTAKLGYKTELTKECAQACLKTCRPFDFLPYEYADCHHLIVINRGVCHVIGMTTIIAKKGNNIWNIIYIRLSDILIVIF